MTHKRKHCLAALLIAFALTGAVSEVLRHTEPVSHASVLLANDRILFGRQATKRGIVVPADMHVYMQCAKELTPLTGPVLRNDTEIRFWVYELTGNEAESYDGRYAFSYGELEVNPKYEKLNALTHFEGGTWYYVMSDTDLFFQCGSGLETLYACGNGIVEAQQWNPQKSMMHLEEECDDGNADIHDGCASCEVMAGWTCTGSPSVCRDKDAKMAPKRQETNGEANANRRGRSGQRQQKVAAKVTVRNTLSDGNLEFVSSNTEPLAGFSFISNKDAYEITDMIFTVEAENASVRAYDKNGNPALVLVNPARPDESVGCDTYLANDLPLSSTTFSGKAYVSCSGITISVESMFDRETPVELRLLGSVERRRIDADSVSRITTSIRHINNLSASEMSVSKGHVRALNLDTKRYQFGLPTAEDTYESRTLWMY